MKEMKAKVLINIAFLMAACSSPYTEKHENISYARAAVENHTEDVSNELYSIPEDYHGLIQSPVNILTKSLDEERVHVVEVLNPHCHAVDVVNTGHSVQLDFERGTEICFDGNRFEFQQAHFHTPSEHQIDGITYPMELHFVNYKYDSVKMENYYLVIAVLFKMGDSNPFIEKFINYIPAHPHDTTNLVDKPIYLDDLQKPSHIDQYDWFHYKGSLTTEPYTETVSWLVMKDILEASPDEIFKINKLEGNNARHIQAMYDREIEE